jgi:hypothetical protein
LGILDRSTKLRDGRIEVGDPLIDVREGFVEPLDDRIERWEQILDAGQAVERSLDFDAEVLVVGMDLVVAGSEGLEARPQSPRLRIGGGRVVRNGRSGRGSP